ncbi:hypothetical protein AAU61_17060 [Desulfocarbo indianensis]|nr:hypothetical protein AAU61_17060 [Desulfocarbo indianensis]
MLVNIGHESSIERNLVVCVLPPGSAPNKRMREAAAKEGNLIDATAGRQTRSLVVMSTGHLVASFLQPDTIRARLDAPEKQGCLN